MKVRYLDKSGNAARDPCFKTEGIPVGSMRLYGAQPGNAYDTG